MMEDVLQIPLPSLAMLNLQLGCAKWVGLGLRGLQNASKLDRAKEAGRKHMYRIKCSPRTDPTSKSTREEIQRIIVPCAMFPRWSHCQDCGTRVVETSWSMLKQIKTYAYNWIHTKHRKNMKNPLTSLNHEITSTAPANAVSTCLGLVRPPDWRRLVWNCWSSIPIKDAGNPKRLKRLKVQNMVSQKKSPSSQPYPVIHIIGS